MKIKGTIKRQGAAIQVTAEIAATVAIGSTVECGSRQYEVTGKGGVFEAGQVRCQYLYVTAVEPTRPPSPFFVQEEHVAKGRKIRLTRCSGLYNEPQSIHLQVMPRIGCVRIVTESSWFRGSAGYGGISKSTVSLFYDSVTDPALVTAQAFIAGDDVALLGLADALEEGGEAEKNYKFKVVRRFCDLATKENPAQWRLQQWRDAQRARGCLHKVGDMVTFDGREPTPVLTVRFDEVDAIWRVGVRGCDAPDHHFLACTAKVKGE